MHLFQAIVAACIAAAPVLGDAVYAYPCRDCGCSTGNNFGSTAYGDCVNLKDSWSIGISDSGLKGSQSIKCTAFPNYDCQGNSQDMGVYRGEAWGCTNTQISWIRSVVCEYTG